MGITKQFGKKVRHFRELRNLSQDQLAELSELHRTYIGSVERGERNITLLNASKIAKALSVSLADLVIDDD